MKKIAIVLNEIVSNEIVSKKSTTQQTNRSKILKLNDHVMKLKGEVSTWKEHDHFSTLEILLENVIELNENVFYNYESKKDLLETILRLKKQRRKSRDETNIIIADELSIATTLHSIGQVCATLRRFDEALRHYNECLEIRRARLVDVSNDPIIAQTIFNIGQVYYEERQFDEALVHFNKSLSMHRQQQLLLNESSTSDDTRIVENIHAIGRVCSKQRRFEEALKYFNECLEIRQKNVKMGRCGNTVDDILKLESIFKF